MDARIRYGSEINVYKAIGQIDPEFLGSIQDKPRNIMSFSHSVKELPDDPGFRLLLDNLGFAYTNDSDDSQDKRFLPPIRVIEVMEAPTDFERIKRLGDGLINLVKVSGMLDLYHDGIIFIDYSTTAEGIIISRHNSGA